MPTTLNAQARWKVRSQTERRHHGGSTEAKIDPAAVAVPQPGAAHLNHWPRSTQLHVSDTSRSFSFPAEESACNEEVEADWQRRYDHEREREKRGEARERREVFVFWARRKRDTWSSCGDFRPRREGEKPRDADRVELTSVLLKDEVYSAL